MTDEHKKARNTKHWRMNEMVTRPKSKHKMRSLFPPMFVTRRGRCNKNERCRFAPRIMQQCLQLSSSLVKKVDKKCAFKKEEDYDRTGLHVHITDLAFHFCPTPLKLLDHCFSLSLTRMTRTAKRVQKKESKVQRGLSSHFVSCCRLRYFLCSLSSSSLRCHAMRSVRKLRVSLTIALLRARGDFYMVALWIGRKPSKSGVLVHQTYGRWLCI